MAVKANCKRDSSTISNILTPCSSEEDPKLRSLTNRLPERLMTTSIQMCAEQRASIQCE
ncbi:hypothetical protein SRABI106_03333 [Rahnella aquatilis]|nr:hypothetical protein SRABI106_03333 [Rahnella aquatilis]